jgi:hypothetical protein
MIDEYTAPTGDNGKDFFGCGDIIKCQQCAL